MRDNLSREVMSLGEFNSTRSLESYLKDEIPYDKLILNKGIYETKPIGYCENEEYSISIGISYESEYDKRNEKELYFYHYNLFYKDEYIDVHRVCIETKEDLIFTDTAILIASNIKDCITEDTVTWLI